MQVTKTNADGLKHEFKIVIPAVHIEDKVDARLDEVSLNVRIPGFRPGKVPKALLKKKYGMSVIGEVLEAVVDESARQAVVEHSIRPALKPKVEITSFQPGTDLEFTVVVEALPDIEVKDFGTISLERPTAEVPDAEIDDALTEIASRREQSEAAAADHAAESGDIVVIDFLGKMDGVPFEGGKADGYSLKLGSNTFIPGFEDQLIGSKAGDDRVVKVAFPLDYQANELAGREVEFDVKVNEVRVTKPATIDDEFARGLGVLDLAALKKTIREEMEKEVKALSRLHATRSLLNILADSYDFDLPPGMVEMEAEAIFKQTQDAKAEGKLADEDAAKTDEQLKIDCGPIAVRRVRLGLLLSEIGQKANVNISQEDMTRAILAEARRYPGQEQAVFKHFQENQDAQNALRAPIFEAKVIDYILELAQVTDKIVSLEELRRDPDAPVDETAEVEDSEKKPKKKAASKKKADAEV